MNYCPHLSEYPVRPATVRGCEECLQTGDTWVHLRMCLVCGKVACCDQSPNRHMSAHFHTTEHPVIRSVEPGEEWTWCFVDELGYDPEESEYEGASLS